ncbi:MAG: ABC transporter substrate-binding protein [Deltaproteobacteria bacterium]|nr:ABC transporter substrate-binding protein [Deltaproteobacteria bacterium]
MDKIHFPYRSESHLPFLHVVAESGSWEKHGLDVEYDYFISSEDAHANVASGTVEFVGGNHISTYGKRAKGDRWVYLGQTVGTLNHRLVVKKNSKISKVADLKGKLVGTKGQHPGLNTWLFIKQNGLEGKVKLENMRKYGDPWEAVRDGKADAAFVTPPADLFARRAGLKVIDVDFLPMVWFTTCSTGSTFVERHPDIVERFLKGVLEGVAYFKTHRDESIKIIQSKYKAEGDLDREAATHLYKDLAKILLPRLYPPVSALANVYELGIKKDKAAAKVDPMALWDFHFLRQIDDSGFIDGLYKS